MLANMAINGRRLLNLPSVILTIFGIDLFNPGRTSSLCIFLLVIQLLISTTALIALKDFRMIEADIWVTAVSSSQVGTFF